MASWHSRYGIPVSAHPHAVGLHPVKSAGDAGGAGYKCVSKSPFKRYAHEDARIPLVDKPVRILQQMLNGENPRESVSAAKELMRRHKGGRFLRLSDEDLNLIRRLTGYGKGQKRRKQSPDAVSRRRIF